MLEAAVKQASQALNKLLGGHSTDLLAASAREMLLRVDSVCKLTGLSTPTIYRLMGQGSFPRPLKLTSHSRAWKLSEIMDWIDSRERDSEK
jgi:prophage regulatory protein